MADESSRLISEESEQWAGSEQYICETWGLILSTCQCVCLYLSLKAIHTVKTSLSFVLPVFLVPYGTGIMRPAPDRSYRPCYVDNLLHHQPAAEACGVRAVDIWDGTSDSCYVALLQTVEVQAHIETH